MKICYDPSTLSPIEKHVKIITTNPTNFVAESISIGQHLFNIQKGYNAAGILFIMRCTLDAKPICIIMKLERDGGAQLTLNPQTKSFDITQVENLMLTEKTRLYKLALLLNRKDFNFDFDGDIMDYQINIKQKQELSSFFVSDFLGCQPYHDPKVTTQKFYNLTKTFISSEIADKIDQAKYLQDLNSYLQKNSNQISPKEFSDDYFTTPLVQDEYKAYLETKKFPYKTFNKDLSLISSKIKKFVVSFKNGISITGSKGSFEKNVDLKELKNGDHQAKIISKIQRID